jgi:TRAP-type C4-dicarboxylate transport system permease small subunit
MLFSDTTGTPENFCMTYVKAIHRASDQVNRIVKFLVATGCASFALLLFAGVVARYFLHHPLIFSAEISKLLFIWSTFLATSVAYKEKAHIRFEFFNKIIGKRGVKISEIVIRFSAGLFFSIVLVKSIEFASKIWQTYFPVLSLSQGWLYVAVIISMSTMILHSLSLFFEAVEDYRVFKKDLRAGGSR